ncbi:hydantoinase/oxoprolinase N-terminal domain-containing protein [Amycolatopsis carbonis]|uniref:Hydantoinase/oxoprolinase N-terminal domain-containing protein n=2 Tax=Amycolatopsis carbonis TaxID=715471 RepID=A0A9Y2IPK6_9PSEU|nr:hydantoinase/oxoprolinase N-terminal domain-containing protein [Amycolatopsis sp. 2-15]WIX84155.1 hydantoinase/oxoprolinase N-terminal domain-containing protein [Amycolatopsis sp. 2-15]
MAASTSSRQQPQREIGSKAISHASAEPRPTTQSYRLGVDVGGTFTDVLLVEETTGGTWRAKTPSTPADQSVGVRNGIAKVAPTRASH